MTEVIRRGGNCSTIIIIDCFYRALFSAHTVRLPTPRSVSSYVVVNEWLAFHSVFLRLLLAGWFVGWLLGCFLFVCLYACVRACVRACVPACVRAFVCACVHTQNQLCVLNIEGGYKCVNSVGWQCITIHAGRCHRQNWLAPTVTFFCCPCVTAVTRKRPRSCCQKCRWQDTAKYACTLCMWLCMKWHGAWLYGVHRARRDGSSFMWHQPCQRLSTPLRWIFKNAL